MAWKNKMPAKAQDELATRTASLHLPSKPSPPHEDSATPLHAPSINGQPLTAEPNTLLKPSSHMRSITIDAIPSLHNPSEDPPLYCASTAPPPYSILDPSTTPPPPKKSKKALSRLQSFKGTVSNLKTTVEKGVTYVEDSAAPSLFQAVKAGSRQAPGGIKTAGKVTAVAGAAGPAGVLAGSVVSAGIVVYAMGKEAHKTYKAEELEREERLAREGKAWFNDEGKLVVRAKEEKRQKRMVAEGKAVFDGDGRFVVVEKEKVVARDEKKRKFVVVEKEEMSVFVVEKEDTGAKGQGEGRV